MHCPDEGDYFGQNMRTVPSKTLTTKLKFNRQQPHEEPKKGELKNFVPQKGIFLVECHYGCKNHYNESLFL